LGFNKSEILMHYTNIFIVLGLIGSILGIILGPIIVPTVMGRKYNLLYQLPSISLPFFRWEYLISVGLLLIIIVLVSIFACRGAMNMVPAASLRGENAVSMNISFLNHFSFMKKIPLAILMAFRNMKRKISRTLMVLLGVMGCSALLVCGFGIEDTINYGIDLELEELIPYDLSLTYGTYDSKKDILNEKEEIIAYDEYAKYTISIEKENMISSYIYLLPLELNVFNVDCQKDECIISSKVAEEIKAKVGDEIHFVYQNKTYDIKITKVVDFCISQGIFITSDTFEDISLDNPTGAWVKTVNGTNNEDLSEELKMESGIVSILTITQMRERAEDVLASIKVMTWTIKIFAILLAVVVLYNLALLNFKERIKDIATLKVLGFSRFEVASSLMIEIIFLTFIGALVGLALGYPLLVSVLSINENPLLSYIYHINLSSYCLTVLITCGSSLLINLIFAILTNKVQMVESLKSVE
ncbi:MAG: FtsX-like permease family protein, partial [Anaeroplasmataceae bacterium]|nr:FtsX-like permease family protein [Anaeroplasmataceae bacterium]